MLTIIGSNISSLVLANQLLECGKDFIFREAENLGSGWSGIETEHGLLDLGQRYFELQFESAELSPLFEYKIGNSHRNFVHHVKNLIEADFELEEVKVQAFFRGEIIKCPLETVDLKEFFSLISAAERKEISSEIKLLYYDDQLDFQRLSDKNQVMSRYSLKELLDYNHGNAFNRLIIDPFINKFGISIDQVPHHLRRKLWCPLFFQQTILDACNGRFKFKPKRPHYGLKNSSNSNFVRNLIARLKSSDFYCSKAESEEYFSKKLKNDMLNRPEELVFATSMDWFSSRLNLGFDKEKFSLRAIWFKCETSSVGKHVDYLSIIDANIPFHRLSTSSHSSSKCYTILCVETTNLKISVDEIRSYLASILMIKETLHIKCIKDVSAKIESPTFSNELIHKKISKHVIDLAPEADLTLCGEKFGANTFNDQVLRGINKYVEIHNEWSRSR